MGEEQSTGNVTEVSQHLVTVTDMYKMYESAEESGVKGLITRNPIAKISISAMDLKPKFFIFNILLEVS